MISVVLMPPYNYSMSQQPLVGVVMGSKNDYEVLSAAVEIFRELQIPHEARVLSAHRTPDQLFAYVEKATAEGVRVMIAGAGGAAHLAGVIAAKTLVPVLAVPIAATPLNGLDSLLSMVQMPNTGHRQAGSRERRALRRRNPGAE